MKLSRKENIVFIDGSGDITISQNKASFIYDIKDESDIKFNVSHFTIYGVAQYKSKLSRKLHGAYRVFKAIR